MKFIMGSSNAHKAQELDKLLNIESLEVAPAEYKIDVVEDGEDFQANAFKKAQAYSKEFNCPVVADDSGLVIPARPDILGIYSARFAPECDDYKDKMQVLLKEIEELKDAERNAYFACVLCFYISEDEYFFFEGRVHGSIGYELQGSAGFGYDPVFYPDGQAPNSLAQLPDWKMANSHRAKAALSAVKFFEGYNSGLQRS